MIRPIALLLTLLSCPLLAESIQIAVPDRDGRIVFPPGESYRYPAYFLRSHIRKSTGIEAKVVKESERRKGVRTIFLGATKFAESRIGSFQKMKRMTETLL